MRPHSYAQDRMIVTDSDHQISIAKIWSNRDTGHPWCHTKWLFQCRIYAELGDGKLYRAMTHASITVLRPVPSKVACRKLPD